MSTKPQRPEHLRILWYLDSEAGLWLAHSLDGDVVGQGKGVHEATVNLISAMLAHLKIAVEQEAESEFWEQQAPEEIERRYAEGDDPGMQKKAILSYVDASGADRHMNAIIRKVFEHASVRIARAA